MAKDLFRPEALEAKKDRFESRVTLIGPASLRSVSIGCIVILIVAVYCIFGVEYTRHVSASGIVASSAGVIKIRAPQAAVIAAKYFTDGDQVQKGQLLYLLSAERFSESNRSIDTALQAIADARKKSIEAETSSVRQQMRVEKMKLETVRKQLTETTAIIAGQISHKVELSRIADDAERRYSYLVEQGYVPQDQYQERRAAALELRANLSELKAVLAKQKSELEATRLELAGLEGKYEAQLRQLERSRSAVDQDVLEMEARKSIGITAPHEGIMAGGSADLGQAVDPQRPLATMLRDDDHVVAELYIPTTAIGFLKPGADIFIKYDAFPFQKFGQYRAKILSISPLTIPSSELAVAFGGVRRKTTGPADESYFVVNAQLENAYVLAYDKKISLLPGMTLTADIAVERRRLIDWILEPLYVVKGVGLVN